jgi:two-component system, cell cycle response regulator DivK
MNNLPHPQASSPDQTKIMIVEDFDSVRFAVKCILETRGYNVIEAVDGAEAVERAVVERPDLILMDIGLPKMDGLSAIRRIRKHAEIKNTPIIALTGLSTGELRYKAFAAGCREYVTKPINFALLESVIGRHLSKKKEVGS